jgi:hypothetical protein
MDRTNEFLCKQIIIVFPINLVRFEEKTVCKCWQTVPFDWDETNQWMLCFVDRILFGQNDQIMVHFRNWKKLK